MTCRWTSRLFQSNQLLLSRSSYSSKLMNRMSSGLRHDGCNGIFQRQLAGTRSVHLSSRIKEEAKKRTTGSTHRKRRGPISWQGLAVAGGVGCGLVYYFVTEKARRHEAAISKYNKSIGTPALGGQWTLVDHTGKPYTDASMREGGHKFALLYFGFTFCPDICPAELIKMKRIIDTLDNSKDIGPIVLPVFISVDPHRDGVAQVAHYIKDFHPRMVGLTGTTEQVSVACKAFRVYHSIADRDLEDEDDYLVDHSIVMYLIGPDGKFLDFYTQLTEVDEAVERIRKIIHETDAE